ncbi:MAG TPA: GAF domain-containing protein, partial [Methylomirabilota bacterium]|nr:GAF domain-containing protein [Methylomirabilota bacterium]
MAEALEQQAATSEILRVISRSPTDPQPVFEAIVGSAARLCAAEFSAVARFADGLLHLVAVNNLSPEEAAAFRGLFPRPPGRGFAMGRAFVDGRPAHVVDVLADPDYDRQTQGPLLRATGYRTFLGIPILRAGVAIGVIGCARRSVEPFTALQIDLVKTFAEQAVIAIENVRLFSALQERNHELTQSLEQQTATSEILRVISSSPTDVQPVLDTVAESAARLCEAFDAAIWRRDGDRLLLVAHHGPILQGPVGQFSLPLAGTAAGRSVLEARTVHVADLLADPDEFPDTSENARRTGFRTVLCVPLMREGTAIGTITLPRTEVQLFSESQIALLETFADQAVIAIENVRLFTELQARNRDLTDALEQQTASAEILRAISSSPTDIRPVLDTVAESAARLCDATDAAIFRADGDQLRMVAHHGPIPFGTVGEYTIHLVRGTVLGRTVLDGRTVHVDDLLSELEEFPEGQELARELGHRTTLGVPLLREGVAIGAITIRRTEVRPFTDRQIALLETFADQAVIAIENVRLFTEVQDRNRELTDTLEQQTATGEILRVISGSPTDVQPVFDTIARNARRLCEADSAAVFTYDGELVHLVSLANVGFAGADALRQAYPAPVTDGHATGRAILQGRPIHIEDAQADRDFILTRVLGAGVRTVLAVPMLRDGAAVGIIVLHTWTTPRPFSEVQIALLETFAAQAVIAIQNVRLFTEVRERNHDLTETLEQQTATGEILRVISSSPTDVQPVFDAIAHSAARLCEAEMCFVFRFDGEILHFVAHHGLGPAALAAAGAAWPAPPTRGSAAGRAILERGVAHIPDAQTDPDYTLTALASVATLRGALAVPMMREGQPVGIISVARSQVGRFTARQIALLQTFADQAVIAIENVRLFTELDVRTRELTRSVDELQALGEVSRAVGSTLDLETVLATIVSRAVQFSGSDSGIVYEFDEASQVFHARATHQITAEFVDGAGQLAGADVQLG